MKREAVYVPSHRRLGDEPLEPGVFDPTANSVVHGHWISGYAACWTFLGAVRDRYPHVLDDLATYFEAVPSPPKSPQARRHALDRLREWARRHGLAADLILKAAASTVSGWRGDRAAFAQRRWVFPQTEYVRPPIAVPIPQFPEKVDRKAWIAIHDQRIAQLRAAGWTAALWKDPEQGGWLADLVVGRQTYSDIARAAHVSVTAVHKDLRKLAKLIGLPLPIPAKGGRPRKPSTTHNRKN